MDAALKELDKLEKLTSSSSSVKSKSPSISDSLDALLSSLHEAKASLQYGTRDPAAVVTALPTVVQARKKDVDDRQKEVYNSLSKFGKALDKRFPNALPDYHSLFASHEASEALERTIALHYLRTGQFDIAETIIQESHVHIPAGLRAQFVDLFRILKHIRAHDLGPALEWARNNRPFLTSRSSPLEFLLHRSQYIRLLLTPHEMPVSSPSVIDPPPALRYARTHFPAFHDAHLREITRLMAAYAYLPLARLRTSPYADLADASVGTEVEDVFSRAYCARLGMSRAAPLKIINDIGGGGALARIEKGRRVMRERRSEWSKSDELPIEIPVPAKNRYHSIFACPVSKEQTTRDNPPMMIACGHVIAKESLNKLSKAGGRVKCPYCPQESLQEAAIRVHF